MVATCFALYWIREMKLPLFITIPIVFAGAIIYLVGVVFLFAEGTILTSAHQPQKETDPRIEENLKEAARMQYRKLNSLYIFQTSCFRLQWRASMIFTDSPDTFEKQNNYKSLSEGKTLWTKIQKKSSRLPFGLQLHTSYSLLSTI